MKSRVVIATLPLLAVTVAAGALAITHASGGLQQGPTNAPTRVPDWFLPIADAYDRNLAITPKTNFAALHFGALRSSASRAPLSLRPVPSSVSSARQSFTTERGNR